MNAPTRRAVAYIVGRVSGSRATTVYDFDDAMHHHFSGTVNGAQVNIFDHSEACHITGNLPQLFHHGNAMHLQLTIDGSNFRGYDYDSAMHFQGWVRGNQVSLYDMEHAQHFNYQV